MVINSTNSSNTANCPYPTDILARGVFPSPRSSSYHGPPRSPTRAFVPATAYKDSLRVSNKNHRVSNERLKHSSQLSLNSVHSNASRISKISRVSGSRSSSPKKKHKSSKREKREDDNNSDDICASNITIHTTYEQELMTITLSERIRLINKWIVDHYLYVTFAAIIIMIFLMFALDHYLHA